MASRFYVSGSQLWKAGEPRGWRGKREIKKEVELALYKNFCSSKKQKKNLEGVGLATIQVDFNEYDEKLFTNNIPELFNNNEFFITNYTLYHPYVYSNSITSLQDSIETSLDLELESTNVADHFAFLRQSTITSFFMVNMVDMPICFKKSKSLYAKTFEIPLLKFSNILMRAGFRGHAVKTVT